MIYITDNEAFDLLNAVNEWVYQNKDNPNANNVIESLRAVTARFNAYRTRQANVHNPSEFYSVGPEESRGQK